jgi:hypothetical protein
MGTEYVGHDVDAGRPEVCHRPRRSRPRSTQSWADRGLSNGQQPLVFDVAGIPTAFGLEGPLVSGGAPPPNVVLNIAVGSAMSDSITAAGRWRALHFRNSIRAKLCSPYRRIDSEISGWTQD